MTQLAIETEALSKQFRKEYALQGIDLKIPAGQVVGLIGTNGSGKTTLLKCLLGLLRPTSGASRLLGEDSWTLSEQVKARIGYVSQEFSLLGWMTTQALCDYTGAFYEHWDHAFVSRLLTEWALDKTKRVGTLSMGQRQKLAVILALGHRPQLLILDEPVASLDPLARRQFLQSLIEFAGQELHTVLFSTHITSDLERIASHVAMLKQGRLSYYGELDTLKESCKRLRIHSPHPLPADLELPGTLRLEVQGNRALVAVEHLEPATLSAISEQWQAQTTVEDLNLEEIFLELSGARVGTMHSEGER